MRFLRGNWTVLLTFALLAGMLSAACQEDRSEQEAIRLSQIESRFAIAQHELTIQIVDVESRVLLIEALPKSGVPQAMFDEMQAVVSQLQEDVAVLTGRHVRTRNAALMLSAWNSELYRYYIADLTFAEAEAGLKRAVDLYGDETLKDLWLVASNNAGAAAFNEYMPWLYWSEVAK